LLLLLLFASSAGKKQQQKDLSLAGFALQTSQNEYTGSTIARRRAAAMHEPPTPSNGSPPAVPVIKKFAVDALSIPRLFARVAGRACHARRAICYYWRVA